MDAEDQRIEAAELDAEPERWSEPREPVEKAMTPLEKEERREVLSRTVTASTSTSSDESIQRQEIGVSRVSTLHEAAFDLDRHPTALSRVQTGRSQHEQTIGASIRSRTVSRQSKKPLPNFGAGKPYPPPLPDREEYVVEFDGPDDPLHAQNWPFISKKLPVALVLGFVTLTAAFGSSIFSAAVTSVAEEFHLSSEVAILGISLYVLGFATGPLLWAPCSELYGRKMPILGATFGFSVFSIAVAVAKDAQTVFMARFFGGFFGACPLACVGAVFADMFNNRQRGLAMTAFSVAVFAGPLLA